MFGHGVHVYVISTSVKHLKNRPSISCDDDSNGETIPELDDAPHIATNNAEQLLTEQPIRAKGYTSNVLVLSTTGEPKSLLTMCLQVTAVSGSMVGTV